MKTNLLLFALFTFSFLLSPFSFHYSPCLAQVPQGFNYQAIARDSKGNPIQSATIKVKLSILSDTAGFYTSGGGTYLWEEEHTNVSTNSFGLFTLVLGDPAASKVLGSASSFGAVDWTISPLYIGVKIANPTDYKNMGSSKLLSVPYGMLAGKVSNGVYTTGSYANPDWITSLSGSKVTGNVSHASLADSANALSMGTKLSVISGNDNGGDALFEVKRKDGQTVFAVYPNAVNIYVPRTVPKGTKGGFAIGGFDGTKIEPQDYFRVTPDSVRIYIDKTPNIPKGATKGGFAIGGFDQTKNSMFQDLFTVSNDSIRMYINDSPNKGATKGGFAIGGFDYEKGIRPKYLNVTSDSTRILTADTLKGFGISNLKSGNTLGYLRLTPSNYFIGHEAGLSNTTGLYNSFIGYNAGRLNTTGEWNVFLGNRAGAKNTTGNCNIFIGFNAGALNTTGDANLFVGDSAGGMNTTGRLNTYLGAWAGWQNTIGTVNVFVGAGAGQFNQTGHRNVEVGFCTGDYNVDGIRNTLVGFQAGCMGITGSYNTYLGNLAGFNSTGNNNVFLGSQAGRNNYIGSYNVFIGNDAGMNDNTSNKLYIANSNTTTPLIYGEFDNKRLLFNADIAVNGKLQFVSNNSNMFMGDSAGYFNTGDNNTALGYYAGYSNLTGVRNVFLGSGAGLSNKGGFRNVYVGLSAGASNKDGNENTVVGAVALYNNTGGSFNTVIGRLAGYTNLIGDKNLFLGYKAGYNETGSNKLYVANSDTDKDNSLIYGEFDNKYLKLNALTSVRDALILEPRSTAPASPSKGMMYFDSNDNKLKVYDGTIWHSLW
jgi:trimeric autotransporter adhesin